MQIWVDADAFPARFDEFLRLKRTYDPGETSQSEWYRHYRGVFNSAATSK
jgi:hypothetical protein